MGARLAFDQEAPAMTAVPTPMCRYHYDALDQITGLECADQASVQRFYRHQHLVTERQGQTSHSVFQHGEQLLAVQSSENDTLKSQLLATDQQRSVLQLIDSVGPLPQVYTAYGHHRVESGLSSLLGFNGERLDPVTGYYLLGNGHRAFNPVLMRFNSPDRLSPFGQGELNSYAYCLGDPVNLSDPTGRFAEIGRLIASMMSVLNVRLGMSRPIPAYNLAKDALRLGALRKLPARQAFAAASTVTASNAILTTGLVGVASAAVAIADKPEAGAILGYVTLGLTTLALASRVGTYWAVKKPGTEADLMSFVTNKGRVPSSSIELLAQQPAPRAANIRRSI
ncbi:RHS repeat-associated core domain-containing protein [Pseudomonas sp. IT-P218]